MPASRTGLHPIGLVILWMAHAPSAHAQEPAEPLPPAGSQQHLSDATPLPSRTQGGDAQPIGEALPRASSGKREPAQPALPTGPGEPRVIGEDGLPRPAPGERGIPDPQPFPTPPPSTPLTERWSDSDPSTVMVMRGGMGICRAASFVFRLEPNVGTLVAMGLEWACLPPTVVAVDYAQRAHGTRSGFLWQGALAVGVAKLWRDFTDLPVVLTFVGLTLGISGATVGAAVLGLVSVVAARTNQGPGNQNTQRAAALIVALAPLGVSFVVTYSALAFLVLALLKDSVSEFLFMALYGLLTPQYRAPEEQYAAQRDHRIRPALNVWERGWMLSTVAVGTGPAFSLWHYVPVVGPFVKAFHKYQAVKSNIRRMAADDFREKAHDLDRVDFTIAALMTLEAAVGSLAQLAVMLNVALLGLAVVTALVQSRSELATAQLLPLAAVAGVTLSAVSTVALFLLVLRQAPVALIPVLVPLAYGVWPDGGLFPAREE